MEIEKFVSGMMRTSVLARLWHWSTENAQHHVTFETFLNENEVLTDRLVESALGNELMINFKTVGVESALGGSYSIENATNEIKAYRTHLYTFKSELDKSEATSNSELNTILDDAVELCSKTLYMLRLR